MDLDTFLRYKAELERQQRQCDRAQGRLETLMERLADTYGCDSLAAGKKLLTKKQKELTRHQQTYEALLAAYEEAYGNKLSA